MSTGTARIIIEEEMDGQTGEEYNIDPLENKGRYYVARRNQRVSSPDCGLTEIP